MPREGIVHIGHIYPVIQGSQDYELTVPVGSPIDSALCYDILLEYDGDYYRVIGESHRIGDSEVTYLLERSDARTT